MQCILNVMQVQLHLITSWGPHLQLFDGVLDCQVGLSQSGPCECCRFSAGLI